MPPISHARARLLAAEAIDFALPRAETAELGGHLASCSACAAFAGRMRSDAQGLRLLAHGTDHLLQIGPLETLRPRVRRSAAVGPATALVGLAACVAIVAGVILLRLPLPVGGPDGAIGSAGVGASAQGSTTVASATPQASRSAGPLEGPIAWRAAGAPQGPGPRDRLATIVADQTGYVAGGSACDKTGCGPALWFSADGATWSRISALTGQAGTVRRLVSWQMGLVALTDADDGRPSLVWLASPKPGPGLIAKVPSPVPMTALAIRDSTILAAGWPLSVIGEPELWTSGDGRNWKRIGSPDRQEKTPPPELKRLRELTGLAAGPNGVIVAGGRDCRAPGRDCHPLLLTSDTGGLEPVATDVSGDPGSIADLAGNDRDLVAVGDDGSGHAVAYWSVDGSRWVASQVDEAASGSMMAVTAVASGFLALGHASDGTPVLWTSVDGHNWRAIAPPDSAGTIEGIAADGAGSVLIGTDQTRRQPAVWLGSAGS